MLSNAELAAGVVKISTKFLFLTIALTKKRSKKVTSFQGPRYINLEL